MNTKNLLGGGNFKDESFSTVALYMSRKGSIRRIISKLIFGINNVEIPRKVIIGKNVRLVHNAYGTVIHPSTIIEDDVRIYQNVTCGRADCYLEHSASGFKGIVLKKGACLCPGAKIICSSGYLVVGENTVIGANAVLTQSTNDNEIWAGVPAKFIRKYEK